MSPTVDTLATLVELMGEELQLDTKQIDYGYDMTMVRPRLAMSPSDRLARQAAWTRVAHELRGSARVR